MIADDAGAPSVLATPSPGGFGRMMRDARRQRGIGVRELARRLRVSDAYISRLELGRSSPPAPQRAVGIAAELGLDMDRFLAAAGHVATGRQGDSSREAGDRATGQRSRRGGLQQARASRPSSVGLPRCRRRETTMNCAVSSPTINSLYSHSLGRRFRTEPSGSTVGHHSATADARIGRTVALRTHRQ